MGIFGSYARCDQKETSDIDILVEVERPIGLKFLNYGINLKICLDVRLI